MTIITPNSASQIEDRIKADVQREAPDSNPYTKVHWLRSLISGLSLRVFDFYQDLKRIELRLMPDTADSTSIFRWGKIYIGNINAASISTGTVIATGNIGGSIPKDRLLTAAGQIYITTSASQIALQSIQIISLTRVGSTCTATTSIAHNLASGIKTTIVGANESEYNAEVDIIAQSENEFTFQVEGTPTTPATGTIQASALIAEIPVKSQSFGVDVNLDPNTPLLLEQPLENINDTLYVSQTSISGGVNEETPLEHRARYLEKIRNPSANFNKAKIIEWAKQIPGVTRVFVDEAGDRVGVIAITSITRLGNIAQVITESPHGYTDGLEIDITGAAQGDYNVSNKRIIIGDNVTFYYHILNEPSTPATGTIQASAVVPLGQVRTYFMRDNDINPIPTSAAVSVVKSKIEEIRPANTSAYDNIVSSPIPSLNDFTFTNILPNTSTMRTAIQLNLAQFFEEEVNVNQKVDEDLYRAAIANTIDLSTGDKLESFVLTSPAGDLPSGSGKIEGLGNVNF